MTEDLSHSTPRLVHLPPGQSLLDTRAPIEAPCGGAGLCGRCRIRVHQGVAPPPTAAERQALTAAELSADIRLACQVTAAGPLDVEILPEALLARADLQVEAALTPAVAPDAAVRRHTVALQPSTIENPVSCWQQIERALKADGAARRPTVSLELVRRRAPMATAGPVTVSLRGDEVIAVQPGTDGRGPFGLAVDLGSTKVAGYLLDLRSGALLAAEGLTNPQVRYGADVVTRLAAALEKRSQAARLRLLARKCVDHLAARLAAGQGLRTDAIAEVVIVANTAMHHLFIGLPLEQLAAAPYMPATTDPLTLRAGELDLNIAPGAHVYFTPPIAGYVGGDHTAMILACRLHESGETLLGLDIGTNTEIVLAHRGRLYCASCASGPAFEGASIHQGVRAVPGAIHQVSVEPDGQWRCDTIGGLPAIGICGSGVVDAVAALVGTGAVNRFGILDRGHPAVRRDPQGGQAEFVLVSADHSGIDRAVVLRQQDIAAVQLAKGAIAAGTHILLQVAGATPADLDRVLVAGAFGSHLTLDSAVALGMLPAIPTTRFRQVGNAAGSGARLSLLSRAERRAAERLAARVQYLELAARPDFARLFTDALAFPVPAAASTG